MSMTGRVTTIKMKDDANPNDIRSFSDAKLQLSKSSNPKVIIKLPPDEEIAFDLDDCSYVEQSSTPGIVECIHINSERQTMIIIDKNKECVKLLDYLRDYLRVERSPSPPRIKKDCRRSPSPPPPRPDRPGPKPNQNKKVNELIGALNERKADVAARIARELAQEQQSIRFALDMINESGNAPPRQPPAPVVELLKMKLSIESFLIDACTPEQYDVTILPNETVRELKQIIHREANILPDQQYWYINRDLLDDNYQFGVSKAPRVNDKTVLILYIAKPPNTT